VILNSVLLILLLSYRLVPPSSTFRQSAPQDTPRLIDIAWRSLRLTEPARCVGTNTLQTYVSIRRVFTLRFCLMLLCANRYTVDLQICCDGLCCTLTLSVLVLSPILDGWIG
jgi:hypothetical protein